MAFPVSPADGQITEIYGVTYQFVSADSAWIRIPSFGNLAVGNINANNITATANITAGNIYTTSGLYWAGNGVAFSGGGIPAGSNQQIQYNNGGAFGASSGLIYDGTHLKVYGNLETLYSSGDEGGEIILAKPQTNTTLAGNITVDIYQNKFRIFENGGSTRGFYLDITSAGAGVGTNIMSGGGGGGGSPAGSIGDIQFNNGGTFGATTLVYNSATGNIVLTDTTDSVSTTTGALVVRGGIGVAGNVTANKLYTTAGLFWSGNGVAFSSGGGGSGLTYTSDTSPHVSPALGDQWYDTSTDILYEYIEDGTTEYWVDVQSPIFNGSLSTNLVGNLTITGNLAVTKAITATGNISTVANLNVLRSANIYGNILGGNIFVSRDAIISSNLTVIGYTTVANIVSSGNITTTGDVSANNISVTNTISTVNIATGNLSITGNVSGDLILTGNVTADNLTVTDVISGNINATSNLAVSGNVLITGANISLGNVANLRIDGGTDGDFLQTYGNGTVSWQPLPLTSIQEFTATGGQTVFTIVGEYSVGTVLVFVNGIQMNSVDYTATSGTTVVLTEARIAGDTVRIVSSVGASTLSSGLVLSVTNTKNFAVAMSIAMGM
jgi:cytoskeletal protein CcmA (bactofilin family)